LGTGPLSYGAEQEEHAAAVEEWEARLADAVSKAQAEAEGRHIEREARAVQAAKDAAEREAEAAVAAAREEAQRHLQHVHATKAKSKLKAQAWCACLLVDWVCALTGSAGLHTMAWTCQSCTGGAAALRWRVPADITRCGCGWR
jgi:hypothetical protein